MSNQKFTVDAAGFAQLQAGRPKWSFVRELISNSLDEEEVMQVAVTIETTGTKMLKIRVIDDGPGFANIEDAWQLFGYTPKRDNHKVRGRFNLGEKEFASIAHEMIIESTSGGVRFNPDGGRHRINRTRASGTCVTVWVRWSKQDMAEIIVMIGRFIPPPGVLLTLNGYEIKAPELLGTERANLPTVVFRDNALVVLSRTADVNIHKRRILDPAMLYEMGIPVQEIECPYHVDVQQKIPLAPNRESVRDSYLQDIYALTLNVTAEDLSEADVSMQWVRQATEDKLATDEAVAEVKETRYGKAVLWSSDAEANERAVAAGHAIIHGKTLSPKERERFKEAGLVNASVQFGATPRMSETIGRGDWDDAMAELADLTQWLGHELQGTFVDVRFIRDNKIGSTASYNGGQITFNLAKINPVFMVAPFGNYLVGLILHELAHRKGEGHFDMTFIHELQDLAGKLALLALRQPGIFPSSLLRKDGIEVPA